MDDKHLLCSAALPSATSMTSSQGLRRLSYGGGGLRRSKVRLDLPPFEQSPTTKSTVCSFRPGEDEVQLNTWVPLIHVHTLTETLLSDSVVNEIQNENPRKKG